MSWNIFKSAREVKVGDELANQSGVKNATVTRVETQGNGTRIYMDNNLTSQAIIRRSSDSIGIRYSPEFDDIEIGEVEFYPLSTDIEINGDNGLGEPGNYAASY